MPPAEAKALALAPRHLAELRVLLERHVPDAEVWAFGSRVNGGAHEGSDLDLLLHNPRAPGQPVPGMAELREALQASALPMLVEAHDAAELPPAFRAGIEAGYVIVATARRAAPA